MKLYTIHYREEARDSITGLAQDMVLVKDGFSWPAFLFPTVWFLAKKMWIVFAIYLAIQGLVLSAVYYWSLPTEITTIAKITSNLILGFEGNDLYRWSLRRARYREHGTIAARDELAAEHRFFAAITKGRAFNRRAGEAEYAES